VADPYRPRTVRAVKSAQVAFYLPTHHPYLDRPYSVDELERRAHEVVAAVKRHVDMMSGETVYPEVVTHDVCVHCASDPEPEPDGYPTCCGKAENEALAAGLGEVDRG
jgi:hypothetical protein